MAMLAQAAGRSRALFRGLDRILLRNFERSSQQHRGMDATGNDRGPTRAQRPDESFRRLRTRPRTAERDSVDAVQVPGSVGGERGWARCLVAA